MTEASVSPEVRTQSPDGGAANSNDVLVEAKHLKMYFPVKSGLFPFPAGQ